MYPSAELTRLAERKRLLRQRIALTRLECVAYAAEAARPLELLHRLREQWRRISPWLKIAGVPLALLLRRRLIGGRRKRSDGGGRWRWLPVVLGVVKLWRARARA